MTDPHLASDDMAIIAAQARVWDNLEARARSCFDAAVKRPTIGALMAVDRALHALHHQYVAQLERERLSVPVETPVPGPYVPGADCQGERPRPQDDFGRNPAPMMPAVSEGRPVLQEETESMFGRVRKVSDDGIGLTLWGGTEHVVSLCQAAALAAEISALVDEEIASTEPRHTMSARLDAWLAVCKERDEG